MDQKITESYLPGQYLDIALFPGQYLDIALAAGQYKIYCPALAFDPPTQSVTYQVYGIVEREINHEVNDLKPYGQSTSSFVVSVLLKKLPNAL